MNFAIDLTRGKKLHLSINHLYTKGKMNIQMLTKILLERTNKNIFNFNNHSLIY